MSLLHVNTLPGSKRYCFLFPFSLIVMKFFIPGFDLNVSVVTTCLHILHLAPPTSSARDFLIFKRCYLRSHKNIVQAFLALLNPTIGILAKTFPSSLSGGNSKCISDSTFLVLKALDDK